MYLYPRACGRARCRLRASSVRLARGSASARKRSRVPSTTCRLHVGSLQPSGLGNPAPGFAPALSPCPAVLAPFAFIRELAPLSPRASVCLPICEALRRASRALSSPSAPAPALPSQTPHRDFAGQLCAADERFLKTTRHVTSENLKVFQGQK